MNNNNSNNNNSNNNGGNPNCVGATNPALILGEIGQNNNHMKHNTSSNNHNWSINYYNSYDDNSKVIGTSSSLSSDENLSLCSSPTSSDSSSSGSGPGAFTIMPFEIVGQSGFSDQIQHQEPDQQELILNNMGQLEQHNIILEQYNNNNNGRLPIFSSILLRK